MGDEFRGPLEGIGVARESMSRRLVDWANINTGTGNLEGNARFISLIKQDFDVLGAEITELDLPEESIVDRHGLDVPLSLGKALRLTKRPDARMKVFLGIHTDTVYRVDHPFQRAEIIDGKIMRGPGVADAKGGLMILLKALETFEASPLAEQIGWEVLLNPDEELGSPGSAPLLADAARRNEIGLIFEPALPGGTLVSTRKGSGNFTVIATGRSAHAGRDPKLGRNAIDALAHFIVAINELNGVSPTISVNVGSIEGGGPVNIVPDRAVCRFNIRVSDDEDVAVVAQHLQNCVEKIGGQDGIELEFKGGFHSPPRAMVPEWLSNGLSSCAGELGITLGWKPSGGTCDGNKLAAEGLPVIDSLGACGGHIHSSDEFIEIDSLVERSRLAALFLMKLASGKIDRCS